MGGINVDHRSIFHATNKNKDKAFPFKKLNELLKKQKTRVSPTIR